MNNQLPTRDGFVRSTLPCHRLVAFTIVIVVSLVSGTSTLAQSQTSPEEAMRKSLDAGGDLPWYDSQSGKIAPVSVQPKFDDSANRDSRWLPKPPKPEKPKAPQNAAPTPTQNNTNSVGFWEAVRIFIQDNSTAIGWSLFVLVVVLLTSLLVYGWSKVESKAGLDIDDREEDFFGDLGEADIQRLEHLPEEVRQSTKNLLSEADRLWNSGKIDEAIIFLFGHRLLQLDRAGAIRLSRGKTNQQYLREIGSSTDIRQALRSTVVLFEQSYFGRYTIESDTFAKIRSEQELFDQFLSTKTRKS